MRDPNTHCVCVNVNGVSWEGGQSSDRASYVNMLHMWLWHWRAVGVRVTPPTHSHPIPFIPSEYGSPFTLISQRRREGGREGGGRGGGGQWPQGERERWSFSHSWLREKEKQLVCKWLSLLNSRRNRPPPSLLESLDVKGEEQRERWSVGFCVCVCV